MRLDLHRRFRTRLRSLVWGVALLLGAAFAQVTVTVIPSEATIAPGDALPFAVTVTGADDQRVTWTSDCGTVLTSDGRTVTFLAPKVCVVTATAVADPTAFAVATVHIAASNTAAAAVEGARRQLALGTGHGVWHQGSGAVVVWGDGRLGALGQGDTEIRARPVPFPSSTMALVRSVAAGADHTLVLGEDGTLLASGSAQHGQLGIGRPDDVFAPVLEPVATQVPSGVRFVDVAAGSIHSLALDEAGGVWSWGAADLGRLGDDVISADRPWSPGPVAFPEPVVITQISAGHAHSLALDREGRVWAWGASNAGQLGDGRVGDDVVRATPGLAEFPADVVITEIAAGFEHAVALDGAGHVWTWGSAGEGRLGNGMTSPAQPLPSIVSFPEGTRVTAIAAGWDHTLVLTDEGAVWGFGALRHADGASTASPIQVTFPTSSAMESIAAGQWVSVAVDRYGTAWSWGNAGLGRTGTGTTAGRVDVPAPLP